MKFNQLLLLIVAVLIGLRKGEAQKRFVTDYSFKNQVKSAISYTYIGILENGIAAKGAPTGKRIFYFDQKGHKIKEVLYAPVGHLQYVYVFDTLGDIILDTSFSSNKAGYVVSQTILKKDAKGHVISGFSFTNGSKDTISLKNLYDEQGNRIEMDGYDSKGKLFDKVVYAYYNNHNLASCIDYSPEVKIRIKQTYMAYDTNGNCRTMQSETISEYEIKSEYQYEYKYDSRGNIIKLITYKDGKINTYTENKIVYR